MIGRRTLGLIAPLLRGHPAAFCMASSSARRSETAPSTVAACIIASEVLNGKTLDTNSHYLGRLPEIGLATNRLAKGCFAHGLNLKHVRVIPDDKSTIVETIQELSATYSLVISSGGIGPTHDDMTYESIAEALNRPLIYHEPTMQLMRQAMPEGHERALSEGQRRMALIPRPDQVVVTPGLWVPLVRISNVLILPGVPRLFQQLLDNWLACELGRDESLVCQRMIRRLVTTRWWESRVAAPLKAIQDEVISEGIQVGSYPKMQDDGTSYVVLSLVGPATAAELMDRIVRRLESTFDGEQIT